HMFDPDHQVRYRTKDGRVAGVSELEFQPELITSQPDDPLGFPSRRMAEMYTTRRDNRPFQAASSDPMELRPVLDPGDQVVFDFTRRQRVHRRAYRDKPLPLMFGNGILSQNKLLSKTNLRSNARVIHVQWPYVILGGQIRIASKADDGASTVEASADGGNFAALPVISINNGLATSLDSWIDAQPSAVYEYWLRIRRNDGTDPAIGIKDVSVDTEFQFAPRAHAQIKPGMNGFVVAVHGKDSQLPENWRGLDVELVWDEVRDK
ncbi:MAG: hypothetical protein GY826_00635, partial [Fuerstiella sp.]|nr:hypothetical protein [Fuerstiella sp.]